MKRRFGRNSTLPLSSATVASAAKAGVSGSAQLACATVDRRVNSALRPPMARAADLVQSRGYPDLLRLLDADWPLSEPCRPPDARPSAFFFPVWRAPSRAFRVLV